MSKSSSPVGSIAWLDLTVRDAPKVRDFYAKVVGWKPQACEMDGYEDFVMAMPENGDAAAGVCHARGVNKGLPPQWLVYVRVKSVVASAKSATKLGGRVLRGPTKMGPMGRFCVIKDPAGAVMALFEPPKK
jgi:uncharacterized protein